MNNTVTVKYFCTSCGEVHEMDRESEPLTAEWYLDRDCPTWFGISDFENETDFPESICEVCYDAILMDGGRNLPAHDLL